MAPELRKRKAPAVDPVAAPPAKKKGAISKVVAKVKEVVKGPKAAAKTNGASTSNASKIAVGDIITLEGFGGEIETNDGVKTTLKQLVEASTAGVILFTYPKASTPGCTKQACSFRDDYAEFTSNGFAVYGLSKDSPKANTSFKEKQNLPFTLLCDPKAALISAINLKKAPASTTRGVFVIDKSGKVLAAEPGSPSDTLQAAKKVTGVGATVPAVIAEPVANAATEEDIAQAKTADEVADTAEKLAEEDIAQAKTADEVADTAAKLDSSEAKPTEV